jgi:hypothetical protein
VADIQITEPGCEDDGDECGERGKRGKRGHRGHHGPTGPTGPTGSTGLSSGGLLKFSGVVAPSGEGVLDSFLADFGVGLGVGSVISLAPAYPIAVQHNVRNLAVRVLDTIVGNPGGTIVFDLLQNGNPVPGFEVTFTVGGPIGNKIAIAGPTTFLVGDRLDLRARATGITAPVDVSATIGIE